VLESDSSFAEKVLAKLLPHVTIEYPLEPQNQQMAFDINNIKGTGVHSPAKA
jgi:hypothetical protein